MSIHRYFKKGVTRSENVLSRVALSVCRMVSARSKETLLRAFSEGLKNALKNSQNALNISLLCFSQDSELSSKNVKSISRPFVDHP